jgi:hypothetical protein
MAAVGDKARASDYNIISQTAFDLLNYGPQQWGYGQTSLVSYSGSYPYSQDQDEMLAIDFNTTNLALLTSRERKATFQVRAPGSSGASAVYYLRDGGTTEPYPVEAYPILGPTANTNSLFCPGFPNQYVSPITSAVSYIDNFSGGNPRTSLPAASANNIFAGGNSWSMETWLYVSDPIGPGPIYSYTIFGDISNNNGTGWGVRLRWNASQNYFEVCVGTRQTFGGGASASHPPGYAGLNIGSSSNSFNLLYNKWSHLVVSWTAYTPINGLLEIWLNGTYYGSQSITKNSSHDFFTPSGGAQYIGTNEGNATSLGGLTVLMDSLRVMQSRWPTAAGNSFTLPSTTFRGGGKLTSDVISASDWNSLLYDLYNIRAHQTGTNPALTAAAAAGATVSTTDTNSFLTAVNAYFADQLTIHASRATTVAVGTATRTSSWVSLVTTTITVEFASHSNAKYWFNQGGKIYISASRTGGAISDQNTSWSNLLTTAGTYTMQGSDIWTMGTGFTVVKTATASSPYTTNNYKIESRITSLDPTSSAFGRIIQFKITFTDPYTDPNAGTPPAPEDIVDGTLTVSVSSVHATGGAAMAGTAGTWVAAANPTYSIPSITGS